jgi:hypothetical protein
MEIKRQPDVITYSSQLISQGDEDLTSDLHTLYATTQYYSQRRKRGDGWAIFWSHDDRPTLHLARGPGEAVRGLNSLALGSRLDSVLLMLPSPDFFEWTPR